MRNDTDSDSSTEFTLSWFRQDVEQRLAFRGGHHTQVNTLLSILLGIILTLLFYGVLLLFRDSNISRMFYEQGSIPVAISLFSGWGIAILFIKWRKVTLQRRALEIIVVPTNHDFILGAANVDMISDRLFAVVDDPRHFVLFNRIAIALSNLRNLGRVTDVDDILKSQAAQDESSLDTSYSLVRGIVWAIPVLGFIGTVVGLSEAIGDFGNVLEAADDIGQIKMSLKAVTSGLSKAFETTLQGLVAALAIQMALTFLKKSEEEFLDQCSQYCTKHIVSRLRLLPYQSDEKSVNPE